MWPFAMLQVIVTLPLKAPVVLGGEPVAVTLLEESDSDLRARLESLRDDRSQNVVLVLREVRAAAAPQASWEVYVGPATATAPCSAQAKLAGVFSLYDPNPAAEYVFPIGAAFDARDLQSLKVTFVPVSGVSVEGAPTPVIVRARVTIGEISLRVDKAGPGAKP